MNKNIKIVMDSATWLLNKIADLIEHEHSKEEILKGLNEAYQEIQDCLKDVVVEDIPISELGLIRVVKWDEGKYVCPIFLHKHNFPGRDNDAIMGHTAYGWQIVEGKLEKVTTHGIIFKNENEEEQKLQFIKKIMEENPEIPIGEVLRRLSYLSKNN